MGLDRWFDKSSRTVQLRRNLQQAEPEANMLLAFVLHLNGDKHSQFNF